MKLGQLSTWKTNSLQIFLSSILMISKGLITYKMLLGIAGAVQFWHGKMLGDFFVCDSLTTALELCFRNNTHLLTTFVVCKGFFPKFLFSTLIISKRVDYVQNIARHSRGRQWNFGLGKCWGIFFCDSLTTATTLELGLVLFSEAVSSREKVPAPLFIHVPHIGFLASIFSWILTDQVHQEKPRKEKYRVIIK